MKCAAGVAMALLVVVSGCSTTGGQTGLAGTGAAQYAQDSAPIAGVGGGGLIGSIAADGLSRGERILALEAEYRTLENTPGGQKVPWKGRGNDTHGEVVAAQPYRVGSQDCRQYAHTVTIDGRQATGRGTACRNPDGSWTPLT